MPVSPDPLQDGAETPAPPGERGAKRSEPDREELELQVLRLRDELIGAEAMLGELRERVERLKARCRRTEELCELRVANVENELAISKMYEQQLEMVLASTTWRVGRMIVKPTFALRRVLGNP
jgi:hypothetical protein